MYQIYSLFRTLTAKLLSSFCSGLVHVQVHSLGEQLSENEQRPLMFKSHALPGLFLQEKDGVAIFGKPQASISHSGNVSGSAENSTSAHAQNAVVHMIPAPNSIWGFRVHLSNQEKYLSVNMTTGKLFFAKAPEPDEEKEEFFTQRATFNFKAITSRGMFRTQACRKSLPNRLEVEDTAPTPNASGTDMQNILVA